MFKKLIFLCAVFGLCLTPAARAANIIWVSDAYDERPDSIPDDQAAADWLRSIGHTVDYQITSAGNGYWRTLDDDKIATLNAADLVIISRNSDSGNYASDATEVAQWNGVTAPLILLSSYISRNSRWLWFSGSSLAEDGGTPTLEAVDPHHPLFNDVDLDAQGRVDIYDQSVGSGTTSFASGIEVGNGTLLAKPAENDWTIIAEWEAGTPFYAGSPQTPAGKRMLFCANTREGEGFGRGEFNLNDEGKKVLSNAIEYMLGNLVREPWVKAWKPDPADGTQGVTVPLFQWTKGETAFFHNVYLGTSPELTEADLVSFRYPLAMHYHVGEFVPGATYYWRVDEVELDGTTHTGDVWSLSVAPLTAHTPEPKDGAKWIEPALVTLKWLPGQNARSHDVYFGTDEDAVAAGTGDTAKGNQVVNVYDPGVLQEDVTYYWRVDEVLTNGSTLTGEVWSFATLVPGGGIRGFYYGNTSLTGLPIVSQIDPQINFNWGDAAPTGLTSDSFSARWVGELDVPFTETYTFYANTDDGVRLWVSDQQILNLWTNRRAATEAKASIDLEGGKRYPIVMEFYDSGGVAVAELRWESPSTPKDLIPQGAFSPPLRASSPSPGSDAVDVTQSPTLTWGAGENATQHEVYFGEDEAAVAAATPASTGIYQGSQALDNTSFPPGALKWDTTYYWRIDEVNPADADSPWTGTVWRFTTADFIVVDNFEGYVDDVEGRIFQTWIDGWGYTEPPPGNPGNGTGATVGYLDPPFAERTVVHGGSQSMPLDYNNIISPFYSETERTWATPQDWTVNGVTDLRLWIRGNAAPVPLNQTAPDAFSVTGEGADIWGASDQFTFVFKTLNGDGSLVARVVSNGAGSNNWTKGGVMVRDTLAAGSTHAMQVMTGGDGNGASFQWRRVADDVSSNSDAVDAVAPPYWVKIERIGNQISASLFSASLSPNGSTWTQQGMSQVIFMTNPCYIGLCVTSHAAGENRTFEFDNVTTTGSVSGQWRLQEIGLTRNDPATLYVAIQDSTGTIKAVPNPDPGAVNVTDWTEWPIPLSDFGNVNMTRVKKMFIGVGNRDFPQPGGHGMLYIDDIRVAKPAAAE